MKSLLLFGGANGGGVDLFSIGHNLGTKLGGLAGTFLILVVGVIILGHIIQHRVAAAIVVLALAMIPAYFFLDPSGATSTLKATVAAL